MKKAMEETVPFKLKWFGETGKFKTDFSKLTRTKNIYHKQKKIMRSIAKIQGHCTEILGRVKQRIAWVINDDYLLVEGKEDEIIGRVQAKLGKTRQEVLKYISEL